MKTPSKLLSTSALKNIGRSSLAFFLAASIHTPAYANPEDGVVSAGAATISSSGNKLDVYQSSHDAIIDWRSFNIEAGEHTQFHQPSSSATALNRVNSADPTHIFGTLTANGNILILNQNGVLFGAGSKVDVNGLIATSSTISNSDFMSGNRHFTPGSNPNATIENRGTISAQTAGLVGLVGPNVINSGTINATLGKAQLASGDEFTLDMYGDGLMEVKVSDDVKSQLLSTDGKINAAGGAIQLTAAAGRNVVNSLITVKGELRAPAVAQKNGKIYIYAEGSNAVKGNVAADKGKKTGNSQVIVEAKLDASGTSVGETGGTIDILGDHVAIRRRETIIDASGDSGGGTIRIGGDYHGEGATPTSVLTTVENGTSIFADAITTGNGGNITVWSDKDTMFYGLATAKGGAVSGNGGFVEVSGHDWLDMRGMVKTSAAHGKGGKLLLDPRDITISSSATTGGTSISGGSYSPSVNSSNINIADIDSWLMNNGDVTIQTNASGAEQGNITWNANYTYDNSCECYTSNIVNLIAHNNIIINGALQGFGIYYTADNNVIFNGTISNMAQSTVTVGNDLVINNSYSGSHLSILSKTGLSTIGIADPTATLNLTTTELGYLNSSVGFTNASQTGLITIGAYDWTRSLYLTTGGDVHILGNQTFGGNELSITAHDLDITGTVSGASLYLTPTDMAGGVGLGDGTGGTFHLSSAEYNGLSFSNLYLGSASQTSNTSLLGGTYSGNVTLYAGTGKVSILNDLTGRYVNINATDLDLGGNLTSSGAGSSLTINTTGGIGLGDGLAGGFSLTSAEFARISNFNTTNLNDYSGQATHIGAHNWNSGTLNVNSSGKGYIDGAQTNLLNADIRTLDLDINANISGTGNLNITDYNSSTAGLGQGATGNFVLTDTEISRIQSGWSSIALGLQAVTMKAASWVAPLTINGSSFTLSGAQQFANNAAFTLNGGTGALTISANQNFGGSNVTLTSGTIDLTGTLTGTGTLLLKSNNLISLGGPTTAATYDLTDTELDKIQDGWNEIQFEYTSSGTSSTSGAIRLGGYTWRDSLKLTSTATNTSTTTNKAFVFDSAATNMGSNNLTLVGRQLIDPNVAINSDGTGTLTLISNGSASANNGIRWGATTTTSGTFSRISAADITSFIVGGGWGNVVLGDATSTGAIVNAYTSAQTGNFSMITKGVVTTGTTNVGNNLSIITDSNPVIGSLTGAGTLTIKPISDNIAVNVGTDSGVGLSSGELANIANGWSQLVFGSQSVTSAVNVAANTWNDNVKFQSGTGAITVNGTQDGGGNNVEFQTAGGAISLATINNANTILARTTGSGNITLGGNLAATANSGNSIILAAGGDLDNTGNYTLSTAGTARWQIYSGDTNNATISKGGLSGYNRYGCTYNSGSPSCAGGTDIPVSGNGFYFAYAPTVTISGLSSSNKEYDGTTTAAVNGVATLSSGVNGDSLTLDGSGATANFANKNVGTAKTVTFSGYTLSGTNLGYILDQGTSTANITAKDVTLSGLTADNKEY
ncbi:MAG: filamentous hemagglutinin N-terminal domain-containing protein, partial [Alphaproteobacteria bacterium]|nr:filamentous hemagglutinin N-terminal domain-containing protein [Alphaproteobacteria bacterium]